MKDEGSIYLSIVIPAYNEEPNLASTLEDISAYLKNKEYAYEIIVVDDGSKDKTAEIVHNASKMFKSFLYLKNEINRGKGYSVKRGILEAKGELILFMDADNSTRINQIEDLIKNITDGFDIAIASRRVPGAQIEKSQSLFRILLGNTYILLSKIILGTNVNDYNCGFKLYKKDTAVLLFKQLTRDDWSFDSELIYLVTMLGLKLKEVPVKWEDKLTSKVKPIRDGIKSLLSLFKIRFQKY